MGKKKVCKIRQGADILNSEFSGRAFQSHSFSDFIESGK